MPIEAILLAVLALALLVLLVQLAIFSHEVYAWYRIYFANRRVLKDRRTFVIHDEFKDDRKSDRRVKK